jgi:hypothetical protein
MRILLSIVSVIAVAGCSTSSIDPIATGSTYSSVLGPTVPHSGVKIVKEDGGGYVAAYATAMARFERLDTQVRFAGRCDSACTMYLGLSEENMCIEPGAFFRFHAPKAGSERATRQAARILFSRYPEWAKEWIDDHGGLSHQLITMDYAYASKFIRKCGRIVG